MQNCLVINSRRKHFPISTETLTYLKKRKMKQEIEMTNFEEDTKKEFDDWFEINRELIEAILLRAFLAGVGIGITKTAEKQ